MRTSYIYSVIFFKNEASCWNIYFLPSLNYTYKNIFKILGLEEQKNEAKCLFLQLNKR